MSVFGIGNLSGGELEGINPHAVNGAFAILAGSGSHEEPGSGDRNQTRLYAGCWVGLGISRCHCSSCDVALCFGSR